MVLFKLVELQEIDKRLMELESFKGNLPEQVGDLKDRVSNLKQELVTSNQELDDTRKLNRMIEMDVKSLNQKLAASQEKIYSVKTNKEYDAITLEIENLENQVAETELKGVEILEKEEKLSAEVTRLEDQLTAIEQDLVKTEFELHEKLNQTESEQQLLLSKRNEIVPTIGRQLLSMYERIRKGKGGVALAEIVNYNCSGCFATIPAQTVVEVRKMDKIISCEVCGRILVATNSKVEKPVATES